MINKNSPMKESDKFFLGHCLGMVHFGCFYRIGPATKMELFSDTDKMNDRSWRWIETERSINKQTKKIDEN